MAGADDVDETTYWCVVGHRVLPQELERVTEEVVLDGAARVRICREHGAPIALRRGPERNPAVDDSIAQ